MTRPRLLDLFCGAGGAAVGYHRAGFDVVGVDNNPQPRYPFEFQLADAMEFSLDAFDAFHASPPCQHYSAMTDCRPGLSDEYPDLIAGVRSRVSATRKPWVIENVVGAPLVSKENLFGEYGVLLCGQMFGLSLYRHRVFETNFPIISPIHPKHQRPASRAGHWRPGTIISVAGNCAPIAKAREVMEIDWMRREELAEAIPPAYTKWVGGEILRVML